MKHLIHVALSSQPPARHRAFFNAQAKPVASPADIAKIYARLLPQIDKIPIYDNHSHATFPDDSDMDAQASPPGESTVMRLREDQSRIRRRRQISLRLSLQRFLSRTC